jgi:hemerythrin-like domain-containing protein
MAKILDSLQRDHANLGKLLDVLEQQLAVFEEGGQPDYDIIQGALDYCLSYQDLYHHPKEDLVFKHLRARDPAAAGAYGDLLGQHSDLAELTRRFAAGLHNVLNEQEIPRDSFTQLAHRFLEVYRGHIRTEDENFLPAAERALAEEDWAEIDAEMSERGDPLFGPNSEERYARLRQEVLAWAEEG